MILNHDSTDNTNRNNLFFRISLFSAFAHFSLEAVSNFLPILYPVMVNQKGLTFTQIGTITLLATLGGTLPQPLFGIVANRFNPKKIILFSIFWCSLLYSLIGVINKYWLILIIVTLGGISSALFHPAGSLIAVGKDLKKRGTTMSIFSVGGNIGAAISPLLMSLILQSMGLRGTVLIAPIGVATIGFLVMISLPSPDKSSIASSQTPSSFPESEHRKKEDSTAIGLVCIVAFSMSRSWYQVSLTTYLLLWFQTQGLGSTATILFVLLGTIPLGSLTGGILSDKIGRLPILLGAGIFLIPSHILILSLNVNTILWLIICFVGLIGFLLGMTYPVSIVTAHSAWPKNVAFAGALVMGIGWLPGGIGASVLGLIADTNTLEKALDSLTFILIAGVISILGYIINSKTKGRPLS